MEGTNRCAAVRDFLLVRLTSLVLLLTCIFALFSQTAFAQSTYKITDGDNVMLHTTSATDPETVLTEAGLRLEADDTYITQTDSHIPEIIVQRNQQITIYLNGNTLQVNSYGETVEELLSRMEIALDPGTEISLPLDTPTCDGMILTVTHTVTQLETLATPVAYETVTLEDPTLPAGTKAVRVEGQDGVLSQTYRVTYAGGEETGRTLLNETYQTLPVKEVIAIGTMEEAEPAASQPVFGEAPVQIGDGIIVTADGEVLTYTHTAQVRATAYNSADEGCDEYTATGTRVRIGTVAVDPRYIPYGTRMFIVSNDGQYVYGISTAEDCGGAIKGDRVDLYFTTVSECFQFGRRDCTIYFLG